jgi:hypothetical protein
MEAVPGDKFKIGAETLVRMAPLIAPMMHRLDVTVHYFFVPNRILWPNWEKFIVDPATNIAPPILRWSYQEADVTNQQSKLGNALGLPLWKTGDEQFTVNVSALPFAAYQKIYNDYYRDQNLIPDLEIKLSDGVQFAGDQSILRTIRQRAWEHDYFTSALPFAQRGGAVDIPLGDVYLDPNSNNVPGFVKASLPHTSLSGNVSGDTFGELNVGGQLAQYDPAGTLKTQATTINELRKAFRLQEFLERLAVGGARYKETILSMFGVNSSDARLQRPEYICGHKSPIVISEVLNTTGENEFGEGLPQGNMSGHGVSVGSSYGDGYYVEEHGYIMGIMSIMPRTAYQQGIPRHFSRLDPLDYYWPKFANLGEQEVRNKELYAAHAQPEGIFGYVPRYSELKYMPNRVAGDFTHDLAFWHLGRIFANDPALNKDFVECNPRKDVFAVVDPNIDNFYCHVLNKVTAIRPMPYFGTPTI